MRVVAGMAISLALTLTAATEAEAQRFCSFARGPRGLDVAIYVTGPVSCRRATRIVKNAYAGRSIARGWRCMRFDEFGSGKRDSLRCRASGKRRVLASVRYSD